MESHGKGGLMNRRPLLASLLLGTVAITCSQLREQGESRKVSSGRSYLATTVVERAPSASATPSGFDAERTVGPPGPSPSLSPAEARSRAGPTGRCWPSHPMAVTCTWPSTPATVGSSPRTTTEPPSRRRSRPATTLATGFTAPAPWRRTATSSSRPPTTARTIRAIPTSVC